MPKKLIDSTIGLGQYSVMPKQPSRTARAAIRTWLASRDKTQRWLAARLQVSEGWLSSVLTGYRPPSPKLRRALERITGIDIADLDRPTP